jgi:hypothetical protein
MGVEMRDIEMGRVDTLVVWRLDRLGRTAKGLDRGDRAGHRAFSPDDLPHPG